MASFKEREGLFTGRSGSYARYRPDYPAELVRTLKDKHGLTPDSVVADMGCGPGILSRLFLENGNHVFCVDPNDDMLQMAEKYLSAFTGASFLKGFAEKTSLGSGSVDFITAGQAFHWFEPAGTRAEFRRILRDGGQVVLVWNERDSTPGTFNQAYDAICRKYSPAYHKSGSLAFEDYDPRNFFNPGLNLYSFSNPRKMDFEAVMGRYSSASYAISEDDRNYADMVAEFMDAFQKFGNGLSVTMEYTTKMYVGTI